MSDEKEINERRIRIKNWLSNPHNLILIGIILIAIISRVYVFSLTKNQALWWDEAEYGLKSKAIAFGTPSTGWYAAREIVVPLVFALILKLGGTEISWRMIQVLISFITVFLSYALAKRLFNARIGLFTAFIMAVNAVHLFFTGRILTYLWAALFFVLLFYLFYAGYVERRGKKYLYSMPVAAGLGISIYSSLAFGVIAIVIYLLITERFQFLKRKETWVLVLIGIVSLLPLLIYWTIAYGSPVARWTALQSSRPASDFSLLFSYFGLFPHLFGWIFSIAIILGVLYMIYVLISSFDLVLKNRGELPKKYILVVLWALAVIGFYTYVAVGWGVVYDAFVISSLPAFAIMGAIGIDFIYTLGSNKKVMAFVVFIILIFGGYYQISYANSMIRGKLGSFDSIKSAGEWIKQNSNPEDIIISASLPQMTYYSERTTYAYMRTPPISSDPVNRINETDFESFVKKVKPKFATDSVWEYVPQWVHEYPAKHNSTFIPAQAFFADEQKTQVSLIIYQLKN